MIKTTYKHQKLTGQQYLGYSNKDAAPLHELRDSYAITIKRCLVDKVQAPFDGYYITHDYSSSFFAGAAVNMVKFTLP